MTSSRPRWGSDGCPWATEGSSRSVTPTSERASDFSLSWQPARTGCVSDPRLEAELDAALYALWEVRRLVSEGGRARLRCQ